MELVLNGREVTWVGDPDLSVLVFLRDVVGITSPKDGCSGEGICGCCTVLVDGAPRLGCRTAMKEIAGKRLQTVEGLPVVEQDAFADAFVEGGGVQCGFCAPGLVMRARGILNRNPSPTRDEIADGIAAHLCRCTGYTKVVDSIALAAEALRDGTPVARTKGTGRIGSRHPRYAARDAVLGRRVYVADMKEPGMLHGALRFSDHPRAKLLGVDVTEAEAVPGVVRVLTARDVPGERRTGLILPDWPLMVAVGEETRYVGDVIALVVAKSRKAAREAAAKVAVGYEVLPPVTDLFEALGDDAPKLTREGNVLARSEIRVGDADAALAGSAHVVRRRFTTQRVEHAFLETEACLALPWTKEGEPGVKVYSAGQGVYEDRRSIARLLGLPEARVDVVQAGAGGAFGGKEDLSVQGHAALAAFLLGRPVKVVLDRAESLRMHPKRHPFVLDYALGCDAAGRLTALVAKLWSDSGAYASVGMKVLERAVVHSTGAYVVPNVSVTGIAATTNNVPCGAMRGFGVNQANFAMESCVDELCAAGGFDRWQFRWDNALAEGSLTITGQRLEGGVGVRACLEALRPDFRAARHAGLAAAVKNSGIGCGVPDVGRAKIVVEAPDRVVIHHGWTEMGQGVHTVAVQTAVEETGLDPAILEVRVETDAEVPCGVTTASRGTALVGLAVRAAAEGLRRDLDAGSSLAQLVGRSYSGEWVCDWTTKVGGEPPAGRQIATHFSYGYAAQMVELDDDGRIVRIVAAHDAGRVVNPTMFEGQIEGAVAMGLGYALSEEFPMTDGRPTVTKLGELGLLRSRAMPPIDVRAVEVADPVGPYGAKGVGEIGLVPTAPAVANALFSLDGVRRSSLPLRDKRLLGRKPKKEQRR